VKLIDENNESSQEFKMNEEGLQINEIFLRTLALRSERMASQDEKSKR
jgi:hypothetical protein